MIQELDQMGVEIQSVLKNTHLPLRWKAGEHQRYRASSTCHICQEEIRPPDIKHVDHNHLTGDYYYYYYTFN
jgi:hypothetical protein